MRITNGMMNRNLLSNLNLNMERMNRLNKQAASGKKFDRPSDDPVAMSKSLKLYTDVSRVDQYERNVRDAQSWLDSTEGAISELGDILQRTRELAVYGANGSTTEEDNEKIAAEVKQLKDQVIKLANTKHAGRSTFTGYQTDKELLNEDGTYNIELSEEEVSVYNVGIAESLEVNTLGSKIFGVKSEPKVVFQNIDDANDLNIDIGSDNLELGDIDIEVKSGTSEGAEWVKNRLTITLDETKINNSAEIETLIQSATGTPPTGFDEGEVSIDITPGANIINSDIKERTLTTGSVNTENTSNSQKSHLIDIFDRLVAAMGQDSGGIPGNFNQDEVSNLIGEIDNVMENALTIRSEIGAKTNRLEMTSSRLSSEKLNFTSVLSENEDVDQAEVIMQFKMAEVVYNSSLAMGGRSIQSTLVDFLR